jgi:hypothetical protein
MLLSRAASCCLCRSEWRAAVEASGAAAAAQLELLQQQLAALATAQQAQGKELLEQVRALHGRVQGVNLYVVSYCMRM